MLPDASRARFDWVGWLVAAVPFGLLVAVGSLIMLFVLFRPLGESRRAPERLTMQMAILGPVSERERRTIWIMGLTVLGFVLGPMVGMDIRIVAPITLVLAVLFGIFDKQGLRELDWGYMLFLGVVLTVPNVLAGVGLDKPIASAILGILGAIGGGPIIFLLVTATITVLTRLVMDQYQGIVLFCTTLMPAAVSLGIDPWLVAITVLATSAMWFVPNQTNSYLMAYAGSEGRLFTHRAARTACFWYLIVVLGSIVLSVPYWRYLGLL
jgi:DASS family divalent anion:Na+ symporter